MNKLQETLCNRDYPISVDEWVDCLVKVGKILLKVDDIIE